MPSPVYWLTVPSKRCTPSVRISKKRSRIAVPLFRIELLGQLHRALHVGEQHGHLLALALERGLGLQDLVGEVLRRVGAWVAGGRGRARPRGGPCRGFRTALRAELRGRRQLAAAVGTARCDRHSALGTELRRRGNRMVTRGAVHQDLIPARPRAPPTAVRLDLEARVRIDALRHRERKIGFEAVRVFPRRSRLRQAAICPR